MIYIHGWKREYSPSRDMPWYLYVFKNRFSRTVIFLWAMCFSTNAALGWQPLSGMFFATGTYRWKCDSTYNEATPCEEQNNAVQSLFTVFLSSQYAFTVIGGLLYDNIGPMYTAAVGECFHFLGWILLLVSSQTMQLYIPSMMLIGASVNVIGLPAIALADMFPSRAALMLAMTVAFQGLAAVIPVVMKIMLESHGWRFKKNLLGYALIFVLPTVFLYPLACPYKKIPPTVDKDEAEQSFKAAKLDSPNDLKVCVIENDVECKDNKETAVKDATDWKLLLTELASLKWLLFAIAYSVQVMANTYYNTTVTNQSGENVSAILGYIYPTIFIWGILLILPIDFGYMSSLIALLITIIASQLSFILSFTSVMGLHYVAICIYTLSESVIYTFKFTYVQEIFKPVNRGLLIGLMGTVSGVASLLNLYLKTLSYTWVAIGYICLAICSCGLVVYLYVATNKKNEELTKKETMTWATRLSSVSAIAEAKKRTYTTLDSDYYNKSNSSSESEIAEVDQQKNATGIALS